MRREFLCRAGALGVAAMVGPQLSIAQQAKSPPRVAYVYIFKEGPSAPFETAFKDRMRELGWVDGRNVVIEVRDAGGDFGKLDAIMRGLVDSKVDVIATACTPEAKSAVKFTSTIPIVMAATGDPVAAGLAASLPRPGGNVTGMSAMLLELSGKRLAILKEAFPNLSHATVLWNPGRPDNRPEVAAMQGAARSLSVRLDSQEVRTAAEMNDALDLLATTGTQAILNAGDPLVSSQGPKIIAFADKHRLPTLFENREFVKQGALMSFGPDFPWLHRRAAEYVDRILKGAKPAGMAIEQPSRFKLAINLKTAKALGFEIPQSVLLQADPNDIES